MDEMLTVYYFKNNINMKNVDLSNWQMLITVMAYNWNKNNKNKNTGYGFCPMASQSFWPKVVMV